MVLTSLRSNRRFAFKNLVKTKAEHAGKYSLMPGKRILQRKPLTELYVNGSFMEDKGAREKELQKHCMEVYVHPRGDD